MLKTLDNSNWILIGKTYMYICPSILSYLIYYNMLHIEPKMSGEMLMPCLVFV